MKSTDVAPGKTLLSSFLRLNLLLFDCSSKMMTFAFFFLTDEHKTRR